MNAQQRPGPKNANGVFTTLNGRRILWTDAAGVTHRCEGADVHPDVRLLWTWCVRDVPAGKAFLPGNTDVPVDCPACLAVETEHSTCPRQLHCGCRYRCRDADARAAQRAAGKLGAST